jgi:hypothetical protein
MSLNSYQRSLRSNFRGYWSGAFTQAQFSDGMISSITRGLTQAWREGAKECDILPGDFTTEERDALAAAIQKEISNVNEVSEFIEANSKANQGKLVTVLARIPLWLNRYRDVRNEAKTMACKDKKLEWRLGATEKHCSTCPRLHGKVKRASFWLRSGIQPQRPPNPALQCGGWNCLCELVRTNKPVSKGPLPR